MHRPETDPEVRELVKLMHSDLLAAGLLASQAQDGSWKGEDLNGKRSISRIMATSQALARLGYLGFGPDHPAVARGSEYIFSLQQPDGSWPLIDSPDETGEREHYEMIPLQTARPLRGLAACGFATDPRSEKAYDWLISQRLPDGAWPTGFSSGVHGYVAGYRRLPHSRWGCRSNTTGALHCLAFHPQRRHFPEARRGLDLLLGRETREKNAVGYEVARLIGAEPVSGFITYYARFDLALILELCWRIGASVDDLRVAGIVEFLKGCQGAYGLWEYVEKPQASRWVTFDLVRSLSNLDQESDWLSLEPSTPFRAYLKKEKRF